jgi:phage recombination protein Bet
MSTELTTRTTTTLAYSDEQIHTLRTTICSELSDSELALFLEMVKGYGLDPFSRQIYALKTGGKLTPVTSIDGLRLIAQRSGQYAGQRAPEFTADGEKWTSVWLAAAPPAACRVSVLRKDWAEPLTVTYTWREYTGGKAGHMQQKMPAHMLAKATEALALRKAFPNELAGLYTGDEFAGDTQRTATPTTQPEQYAAADRIDELKAAAAALDDDMRASLTSWCKQHGIALRTGITTTSQAEAFASRVDELAIVDAEVVE